MLMYLNALLQLTLSTILEEKAPCGHWIAFCSAIILKPSLAAALQPALYSGKLYTMIIVCMGTVNIAIKCKSSVCLLRQARCGSTASQQHFFILFYIHASSIWMW
jgi:hypothetical protein